MIRDECIDFVVCSYSFGITLEACGHGSLYNEKSSANQRTISITPAVSYINVLPVYAVILAYGLFTIPLA